MINRVRKLIAPKNSQFKNVFVFILTYFFLALFICKIINILLVLVLHFYNFDFNDLASYMMPNDNNNSNMGNNVPSDPVRWWPSGFPQSLAVTGTSLATYTTLLRFTNCSPRTRVTAALMAGGISTTTMLLHSAIENSVGFNRFMFSIFHYTKSGNYPSIDEIYKNTPEPSQEEMSNFTTEALKHADHSRVDKIAKVVSANEGNESKILEEINKITSRNDSGKNFLPDDIDLDSFLEIFGYYVIKGVFTTFKQMTVEGYLDDLIGQRMVLEALLFFLCICTFILFLTFLFNVIFLLNRERISNTFDNKIVGFYIKYQIVLSWITFLWIPFFIILSLGNIIYILYWLVTHQIPFDTLDIDLHQYVSSKTPFK